MSRTATIVEVLGGPGVVRGGPGDLVNQVREGLPFAAFEAVLQTFRLGKEALASVLAIPVRTLIRRKKEERLQPAESDRLVRLARILALAVEVLGSREKASAWMQRPNRAFGGEVPLALVDTDLGTHQVEEVLGRIEHGVYS